MFNSRLFGAVFAVLVVASLFVFSKISLSDDQVPSVTYVTWDKDFKELLESVVVVKQQKPNVYGDTYSVFQWSADKFERV